MKYFLGFIVTVILVIFVAIMFIGDGGDTKTTKPAPVAKQLVDYANTDVRTELNIDGPVNANSEHEQINISVGRNSVIYQKLGGYDGKIIDKRVYSNTPTAYANFLKSMTRIGFDQGDTEKSHADERGHCPQGDRFVYKIVDGSKDIQRFWSTSCGKLKTFTGNSAMTVQLFKSQVPDYYNTVKNQ